MKVSELTGKLLDFWAAKAKGDYQQVTPNMIAHYNFPAYSTDWAQGGPIMEQERIGLEQACPGEVYAYMPDAQLYGYRDEKPLVAAMRAFVASKFGDEVPDE